MHYIDLRALDCRYHRARTFTSCATEESKGFLSSITAVQENNRLNMLSPTPMSKNSTGMKVFKGQDFRT